MQLDRLDDCIVFVQRNPLVILFVVVAIWLFSLWNRVRVTPAGWTSLRLIVDAEAARPLQPWILARVSGLSAHRTATGLQLGVRRTAMLPALQAKIPSDYGQVGRC